MDKVRAILAEADGSSSYRSGPTARARFFGATLGYIAFNASGTAYDYRVASTKAAKVVAEDGASDVHVALRLQSFGFSGKLTTRAKTGEGIKETAETVSVFPHVYLSDMLYGRSKWTLNCRKTPGQTKYWTAAGHDMTEPAVDLGDDGADQGGSAQQWSASYGRRGGSGS